MLSSHYSLLRLELECVGMTLDNVHHIAYYISTASQLQELELGRVWHSDVDERYVHNLLVESWKIFVRNGASPKKPKKKT